jgi:hypothetical protein
MAERFAVGDMVRPVRLWRDDPNRIPSGRVREIVSGPALYVEGDHRAFLDYVFEKVEVAKARIADDAPLLTQPQAAE